MLDAKQTQLKREQGVLLPSDLVETTRALKLFIEPGEVRELRALGVPCSNGQTITMHGFFCDVDLMAKEATKLSDRGAVGVYFTPNPVHKQLLPRAPNKIVVTKTGDGTKDHEIIARHWLPVDIDSVRPRGVSATDEEHVLAIERCRQCLEYLAQQGWPKPIVVDSGNGCHLFYPVNLPNDQAARQLVERVLKALASRFDDDHVIVDTATFNAARLMRIPGTMARKGFSTMEQPHRQAKLLREIVQWSR